MIKNKLALSSFILIGFLAISTSPALAEENDSTPTPSLKPRQELRQEIKDIRQNTRQEIKQTRFNAINAIYKRLRNGLNQQFTSLENSKARIQERITKKLAQTNLTDTQKQNLKDAQDKLNSVAPYETAFKTDLATLDAQLNNTISAAKPADLIPQLKDAVAKVRADLKNIRTTLTEAIRLVVKVK